MFPVRKVNFTCTDETISYKKGDDTYSGFAYNADIPYEVIIGLSFAVPPFIVSPNFDRCATLNSLYICKQLCCIMFLSILLVTGLRTVKV